MKAKPREPLQSKLVSSAPVSQEENVDNGAGENCALAILPVYVKSKRDTARQLNLDEKGTELIVKTMRQVRHSLIINLKISGKRQTFLCQSTLKHTYLQ